MNPQIVRILIVVAGILVLMSAELIRLSLEIRRMRENGIHTETEWLISDVEIRKIVEVVLEELKNRQDENGHNNG